MTTTEPLDVMDECYDAIVIGTGMGGGAVGHSLVAAGLHVLFVEKGLNAIGTDLGSGDDPERRLAAGWWPDRFSISIDGRDSEAPMPLGCGVGGSTNLYSAALERFEPSDIEPEAGERTPGRWPVPWSEWMRWYDEAERSLQVRSEDRAYPAASAIDRDFAVGLGRNGLHPYRLHVGLAYRPGCTECGGHKCPLRCKSDASTIFIEPALATGRATLMAECEVLRIDASARRADAVVFRRGDGSVDRASARVVVLAAGACSSPAILLRSTGASWPRGLANTSDMVGRHLMFHANEWIAVWPRRRASSKGPRKTVGFRDFYRHRGLRLGSVQSTGLGATFGNIWGVFRQRLALSRLARVPGVPFALKCAAWMGCRLLGSATIFVITYQAAGGLKWDIGRAHLSTDIAYTRSRFKAHQWSVNTAFNGAPTVDVDFFADKGTAFDLPGFDASDPANYIWRGYYENRFYSKGTGWQGRADLDLDTDIGWLPKIQVGARYTDRDAEQRTGTRDGYTELLGIPLANVPLGELQLTPDTFRGDVQGFRSWLAPTRGGILDNREALRRLTYESLQRLVAANPDDIGARNQLRDFSTVDLAYNPLQGFTAQEQTYAAYAQGQYKFDIGSVGFDGVFGVRAINTVGAYTGISSTVFGGTETREPRTTRQNYVDVLPNISLRVRPTEKFQLRFAFTKTRTQPGFGQLNPALRITQNTSPPDPNNPVARPNAFGEAGNPDLQPLTSKNYDATAEWYFSRSGSISAAFFYRDVFGFIGNYTRRIQDPVFGLIEVNRPENAGAGRIKGVELAGQTFLDFLPGWLSGFGVQGNVTYIQGKNRLPTAVVDDPPFVDITGLSKWTYNVALFYEKGPISTRVSYNSRSDFTNFYSQATPDAAFTGEATRSVTRLDASFNYTPVKSVTFTVDASNLLAKPYNNYAQYAEDRYYPRDVRDEGRYYGVGVRFRY